MTLYDIDLLVDNFETDEKGYLRAPLEDASRPELAVLGQVVCICDDEMVSFARVVRVEGDQWTGVALLEELTGDIDEVAKLVPGAASDDCDVLDN